MDYVLDYAFGDSGFTLLSAADFSGDFVHRFLFLCFSSQCVKPG